MAALSQGMTVTLDGVTLLATRIVVNNSDPNSGNAPRISTAHLGSDPEKEEPYALTWKAPDDGSAGFKNVQVDHMGGPVAPGGINKTLQISGPISYSATGTVVSSSVTSQVGDFVRSTFTLRVE